MHTPQPTPRWHAALGLCLLLLSLSATALTPGRVHTLNMADGESPPRSYRLYIPQGYRPQQPAPLLVALHGYRSNGHGMEILSGFNPIADRHGLLVVYPDAVNGAWNAGRCCAPPQGAAAQDDLAFLGRLIAQVGRQVALDPRRIYGTGFSNGAMMVHRAACEAPQLFAAIASVAGGLMLDRCAPARGTPTLMIQGRDDPRIPWQGGTINGSHRPSMQTLVQVTALRNGCDARPPTRQRDGIASCGALPGCRPGESVEWCGLDGVGHQWPGSTIHLSAAHGRNDGGYRASEQIVAFMLRHRR